MSWRLARSLETLRSQVNAAYPNRSKVSDGTIGDAAHAASASDHNPNRNGVVCALDLTHDPKNGFDAHALAEHLRVNRHPNLRYVISNARIAGAHTGWQWRPSVGHYQHCHISVGTHGVGDGQTYNNYDSTAKWNINAGEDEMISKTTLTKITKGILNRPPTKTELSWVGKKSADVVIGERYSWAVHNKRDYASAMEKADKTISALNKQLADVKKALSNEKAKPAKQVVKEVEKIVEKPVYIDRPVGEEEAVRGFFGRLIDMVFKK